MFLKHPSHNEPCKYTARYVCNCHTPKWEGSNAITILDVRITDHKKAAIVGLYQFGNAVNSSATKFCPGCGTEIPTPEAILTMEELSNSE